MARFNATCRALRLRPSASYLPPEDPCLNEWRQTRILLYRVRTRYIYFHPQSSRRIQDIWQLPPLPCSSVNTDLRSRKLFFRNTRLSFRESDVSHYQIPQLRHHPLSSSVNCLRSRPQSQGMTLMDKAVNRLAALFSPRQSRRLQNSRALRQQRYPALLSDM